MAVFAREVRANLKLFAVWALVIALFLLAGTVKYTGVETGGAEMIEDLLASFPRVALAMFGMADVDILTFPGFFAVLEFYIGIMMAVFAVQMGRAAVSRELVDGTYEFLFVKPWGRGRILACKLAAAFALMLAICAVNYAVAQVAYAMLGLEADMTGVMGSYTLWLALMGALFLAIGAACAALAPTPEMGARAGNCCVLVMYAASVVYDVLGEDAAAVRLVSPLKYFLPNDVVAGTFDPLFLAVVAVLAIGCMALAFGVFTRRDLAER